MFSGKTTKLISLIEYCKQDYIIINHSKDTRYGIGQVITHNGKRRDCFSCENADNIIEQIKNYNISSIFIDEIQFFDVELFNILAILNINIYVCGLDRDFRGEYFEISKKIYDAIVPENRLQMKAICECGRFATMTAFIGDKPKSNIIPGVKNYKPTCEKCHS